MDPKTLRYSKEHEWIAVVEGDVALVGISDYAQEELGDVVYVDLPAKDSKLQQFKKMGEVESVKAVSDLFSPVSGTVVESNDKLSSAPELVNQDPYGEGWIARVRLSNKAELNNLMSYDEYQKMLGEAPH